MPPPPARRVARRPPPPAARISRPTPPAARRTPPPPATPPRTARDDALVTQGYPPGSRQYDYKTILTGYIHYAVQVDLSKAGRVIRVVAACGEAGRPYVWRDGGLRFTTATPYLTECPACRETDAFWDRMGDFDRIAAGRKPRSPIWT